MTTSVLKRPSGRVGTAAPLDWHPEDIKAAVRKSGISLEALSMRRGLHRSAAAVALKRPWPRAEAIIAAHLGVPPSEIWPSRYEPDGSPKPGVLSAYLKDRARRRAAHSQKPTDR